MDVAAYTLRIFAAFHGQPYITDLFLDHLDYLRGVTGLPLPITAVCSTDEDHQQLSARLDIGKGDYIVQAENFPVSQKHNVGMDALLAHSTETHVLHLGSDDLASPDFIERIMAERPDFAGLNGCHFADLVTKRAAFYRYYNENIIGAGRVMAVDILRQSMGSLYVCKRPYYGWKTRDEFYFPDKLAKQFIERGILVPKFEDETKRCALWPGAINSGLDNLSNSTLRDLGFTPDIWEADSERIDLVDLKGHENITAFERIIHQGKAVELDYSELVQAITPYNTK